MKVFFTQNVKEVEERNNINAVDIWTDKYLISIRESGIRVVDNKTKEDISDTYMNLETTK
jgi:hypothetical protein